MNLDNEHAGRTSTWHLSPGGEKGKRHVEDQQARVEALQSDVRSRGPVVIVQPEDRWRAARSASRCRFPLLVLFWIAVSTALGCSSQREEPDFTLRIAEIGPFEPFTPSFNDSMILYIKDLVYETLLVPGETGELVPRLARSWQRLPSGNIFVELDGDRRFSDGSSVTVQDVADSLAAAGLRSTPRESGLEIAPDVKQMRPEVALLRSPIFKKSGADFLGTGAFVVVYQDRERIALRRIVQARNRINRIEVMAYQTDGDRLIALKKGECNLAIGVQPRQAEFTTYVSQLQMVQVPSGQYLAVILNQSCFSSRERKTILSLLETAGLEGVDPDLTDAERAALNIKKQAQRSVSNLVPLGPGPRLTVFTWEGDWMGYRVALATRRVLDFGGHRGGEVVKKSPPEAAEAFTKGRFDIIVTPVLTWPEAESLSFWRSGGRFSGTGYSNPALDAALDAGDWKAAREAFDRDPPGVFPMEYRKMALLDPRIVNPTFGRYLLLETLPDWEVRQ